MNIKLIAIDIDGTLINSNHQITPRVHNALMKAREKGVYIVLCTGRPLPGVLPYLEELQLMNDQDFVITYNGSLVQQTGSGQTLVAFAMSMDDLRTVEHQAHLHNVHFHAIDQKNIYVTTPEIGKYSHYESKLVGMPIVHQSIDDFEPHHTFSKMMLIDEEETLNQVAATLSENFRKKYHIVRSMPFYLEVLHPKASKGQALQQLAQLLNLSSNEVMCIGDQENDRDMIEYAGVGVAMGNAVDSIKKIASFITTTNDEDGVAVAVEKYVLENQ